MSNKDLGELATTAEEAKRLLSSNVFNEAFDAMNRSLVEQILATPPEADAQRERLYAMFKAGQMFVQQLAGLINNYELAKQREDV